MALLLVLSSGAAVAAGGDPEAGRRKTVTCNGCHAQSGMKNVPALGGQSESYFVAAMRAYQEGKRPHATMRDVAKAFTDRELKDLAAHYARFGLAAAGEGSGEAPAAAKVCESCHGAGGREPVHPDSPVIAGQRHAVLRTALREYRSGAREHAVMQPPAAALTDADIDALADHFSRLPGLGVK